MNVVFAPYINIPHNHIVPKPNASPKTIQTKEERVNLVYAAKVLVPNDGSLKIGMPGEVYLN